MVDIEFEQGYPVLCSDCKFLEYNNDNYGEDLDGEIYDEWYTCSCPENSDNEYDLPFGESFCKFKIKRKD